LKTYALISVKGIVLNLMQVVLVVIMYIFLLKLNQSILLQNSCKLLKVLQQDKSLNNTFKSKNSLWW